MAVSVTTFLSRFPEFENLETYVVTATIEEAERQNDATVWGDLHDDAVNYMTAHLLSSRTQAIGQQIGVSPNVRVQRYVGVSGYTLADTTYGATYLYLRDGLPNLTGFSF
tara:strand:- start:572 stop:901 length:330 start_codon:yes stop_codon:yes gene_type:complete